MGFSPHLIGNSRTAILRRLNNLVDELDYNRVNSRGFGTFRNRIGDLDTEIYRLKCRIAFEIDEEMSDKYEKHNRKNKLVA